MKAFQVISTLLLIGVLSSVINAQHEGKLEEIPNPFSKVKLGTALIRSDPKVRNPNNILCSGVLLRPHIMLTIGSCVDGKKPAEIAVEFKKLNHGIHGYEYPVSVYNITYHPKYKKDEFQYNLAMLFLSNQCKLDIYLFSVTTFHYTPLIIMRGHIDTTINRWKNLASKNPDVYGLHDRVTLDYTVCDAVNLEKYSYCLLYSKNESRLTKEETGTPLYFHDGATYRTILLGLYAGPRSEITWGPLYQDINPSADWIIKYVTDNPFFF